MTDEEVEQMLLMLTHLMLRLNNRLESTRGNFLSSAEKDQLNKWADVLQKEASK